MGLDIRWPLGLLFFITGCMMAIYGAVTHGSAIYAKSQSIDINLVWGLVLVGFGLFMLLLAWSGGRSRSNAPAAAPSDGEGPADPRPPMH